MTTAHRGHFGEALAKDHLLCNGYSICAENIHSRWGEIDLVAEKDQVLFFFEVKQRKEGAHQRSQESIGIQKLEKVVKTAQWYLLRQGWEDREYRFSALCIDECKNEYPKITVIHDITEGLNF